MSTVRDADGADRRTDLLAIPGVSSPPAAASVPVALALAAVALQIAYPLVSGGVRDALTVVTVVVFAAAGVTHAAVHRGGAFAARLVAVTTAVGLVAELVGVRTGFPFGSYTYTDTLGPSLGGVPVVIPLAWLMMAYPAAVVGRHIARTTPGAVVGATLALAAWDLYLDPQMVAAGHWVWDQPGPALLGIPLVNHLGWLLTALAIQALLVPGLPSSDDDRVPIGLYVWTWFGSAVAHALWLGLPGSAVSGGLAMGAVVAALALSRRR